MKILLIGASGTIGQAVEKALSARHQVVRVGRTKGDFQVDIASADSIKQLYERTAPFDAVVCAAGAARFAPLDKLKIRTHQGCGVEFSEPAIAFTLQPRDKSPHAPEVELKCGWLIATLCEPFSVGSHYRSDDGQIADVLMTGGVRFCEW